MPKPSKKKLILPYVKPSRDELNKISFAGILLIVLSISVFLSAGMNNFFWLFLVAGAVLISNSFWLKHNYARPFLLKYVFTMIRTKRFISAIRNAAKHAKWFEAMSLVGVIFGFGLAGVDYFIHPKSSKFRRATLLLSFTILLSAFFYLLIKPLFSMPVLEPLFLPSLVGFVLLGFGGMSLAMLLGYGVISFIGLFSAKELCPALMPVIPGVPIPGLNFSIPLIGWVSLVIVLVVHELSHGVLMAYYKEKIKSVGLLLAGIFPVGAFVEQEDITFEKLDDLKMISVLSAGSASNLILVVISWVLLIAMIFAVAPFAPAIQEEYSKVYSGVSVVKVNDSVSYCGTTIPAPAKGKLFEGDIVKQMNGVDINGITALNRVFIDSNGEMSFVVLRFNPDSNSFEDINTIISPHNFEDLGLKRIGVEFGAMKTGYEPKAEIVFAESVISNISMIVLLLFVISFAAGSFNYLPSDPFDGGKMAKIILEPYFGFMKFKSKKETRKFIGRLFIWLLLLAVLLNLIPYATLLF